ncbi:MAG: adenylyltransferase/cytidyltransferase family protein [Bacteroidetes bacterium]|jgi:pantetheine-phosphate adenylyltransferase|nr:adenylyltransferase/cytidyltransferase family protein [Bacteroidota bacterium]
MDIQYIKNRLKELGFDSQSVNRYHEHHRYYHTEAHILYILQLLEKQNLLNDDELFLTTIFHDIIYDPNSATNEEDSAKLFKTEAAGSKLSEDKIKNIYQLILDTKTHKASSEKSQLFIDADLNIFNESDDKLFEYEKQIFKEFQFVDYKEYKPKRIEILQKFNKDGKLDRLIAHVQHVQPTIAVFPGSFNPFHKGHYNVLQKAEHIFDKVIIAFGKNPDKNARTWDIPRTIQNRQMMEYEGLVTDFVDSLSYDVVVIRGLRNSTDFQYEQNQYRYIQELKPGIKIVSVFCDKEFEHISSSGIRTLEKYNKHQNYLLD